jgi:hypothetical protein
MRLDRRIGPQSTDRLSKGWWGFFVLYDFDLNYCTFCCHNVSTSQPSMRKIQCACGAHQPNRRRPARTLARDCRSTPKPQIRLAQNEITIGVCNCSGHQFVRAPTPTDPAKNRCQTSSKRNVSGSMCMQKEANNCPQVNRGSRHRAGTPPTLREPFSRHCSIPIGRKPLRKFVNLCMQHKLQLSPGDSDDATSRSTRSAVQNSAVSFKPLCASALLRRVDRPRSRPPRNFPRSCNSHIKSMSTRPTQRAASVEIGVQTTEIVRRQWLKLVIHVDASRRDALEPQRDGRAHIARRPAAQHCQWSAGHRAKRARPNALWINGINERDKLAIQ